MLTLARATGEDPGRVRIMAADNVDPELKALYVEQLAPAEKIAAGPDPSEAAIMASADPELRALWLARLTPNPRRPLARLRSE